MLNNYKIYCEKYEWDSGTLPEDINFFSDSEKTLIETLNIHNWITKIGKLKFSNENTENKGGYNYNYFEDSDLSITVQGDETNNYLSDFFEIFTNNLNYKWLIKIYNLNETELYYTGIININKPTQTFKRNESGDGEITLSCLGMLKEFRNYYANKSLTNPNEINWVYETIHQEAYASGTIYAPSYNNILEGKTITIAGDTYTFTHNTPVNPFDVYFGNNIIDALKNLVLKVNQKSLSVTASHNIIMPNPSSITVTIRANIAGTEGNGYSFTTNAVGLTLSPTTGHLSGGYSNNIDYNHRAKFIDLLSQLLNIEIELDNELMAYYVTRDCILTNENTYSNNYKLFKSSYERIYESGESVWGFIRGVCNSRGYIPFIENGILKIHNRSNIDKVLTFDYNKIIPNLKFTKEDKKIVYDYIILFDGRWEGGDSAGFGSGSERRCTGLYMFTNKSDNPNRNIPFAGMTANKVYFEYNKWFKILSSDTKETKIRIIEDLPGYYGGTNYVFPTDNVLFIDGGDTKNYGWVFDNSSNVNRPHTFGVTFLGDDDIYFQGNYGNCLFKYEDDKIFTYAEYMLSDLAKNNFSRFLNNSNLRKAELNYDSELFNPLFYISFINDNNNVLSDNWRVNDLEVDIENGITNLNIQQKI